MIRRARQIHFDSLLPFVWENLNKDKNIHHHPNLDLLKPMRVLCTISWQIDRFIKRKIGDTKHKVSRLKATQTITTADFSLARNGKINEKKLLPAFLFSGTRLVSGVEWKKEEIVYLKNDFVRSIVGCYGVHITMETLGEWERGTKMWKSVVAMTVWLSSFVRHSAVGGSCVQRQSQRYMKIININSMDVEKRRRRWEQHNSCLLLLRLLRWSILGW